jgi:hypothetical protein
MLHYKRMQNRKPIHNLGLSYFQEKHIRDDLRKLLPTDDPKAPEKPAEEAFRQRM